MKHIEIVVAVIVYGSKILCVKRADNKLPYIAFKWEFPGGKIEENESPTDALVREVQEELKLNITIIKKITKLNHHYPDFFLTMHAYLCSCETKAINLNEHIAHEWRKPTDLYELDWLAADIPLIEELSTMTL